MSLPTQPDVPPPRPPKPASMKALPGPPPKGPAPHPPPSRPPPKPKGQPTRPPPMPPQPTSGDSDLNKRMSQPPPLIPLQNQNRQSMPQRPSNPPPHPDRAAKPLVPLSAPPPRPQSSSSLTLPKTSPPSSSSSLSSSNTSTAPSSPAAALLPLDEPNSNNNAQALQPSLSPLSATGTDPSDRAKAISAYEARKARRARKRQAICLTHEDLNNIFKTAEGEAEMSYMEVAAALATEEEKEKGVPQSSSSSVTPSIASLRNSGSLTVPMGGCSNVVLPSATAAPGSPASSQLQGGDAAGKGKGHKDGNPEYEELLEMAKMEDLGDLDKQEFLFTSGYDSHGRTILVLIGANLPSRRVPLDKLFLYFLRTLDPVVTREYVLIYFAKGQSSENRPPFSWLRKAYGLFSRKYKKNLKGLYVVQPTTWLRMVLKLFKPFVSKKFWAKVHLITSFEGIYEHISPSQLRLPGSYVEQVATMRPLFGESLETVVQNPAQQSGGVPIIVSDCISYLYERGLDAEGLLRISGNRSMMNEYRLAYDSGKSVDIKECNDPHTVANLLKLYLRELPEPIFTYDLYRPLIQVQAAQMTDGQRVVALAKVLGKLPQANKLVLWHLVSFAAEFANHAERTKMTPDNIALCLAPTLMWCRPEELSPATAITEMGLVNSIFKTILLNKNCLIDN